MRAIGLDVHKKTTVVAWVDTETGEVASGLKVLTQDLVKEVASLPGPKRVALETGTQSHVLARQMMSLGIDVLVVNAFKVHRLFEAMKTAKTDKLDAKLLARFLADGLLEQLAVWVPDEDTHHARTLTRLRKHFVEQSTRVCSVLRAFLRAEGEECPYTDLSGKKAQVWLDECEQRLPSLLQSCFQKLRQELAEHKDKIAQMEAEIKPCVAERREAAQISTINGAGAILSLTIAAELGTLQRFPSVGNSISYGGLAPSVSQTGEHRFTGPLPHQRNPHLQCALIQLAQHFAWSKAFENTRLKRRYYRVLHKYGPNPAKVALARDLLRIIFAMLRDGTEFKPELLAA